MAIHPYFPHLSALDLQNYQKEALSTAVDDNLWWRPLLCYCVYMTMSCDATLSWHEVRTLHHDHDQLDIMIHDQTTLINTNLSSQSSSDHYASNFPSLESRGNCEETVRKPTNKPLVNHLISDLQQLNHFLSHQLLFMTTMEKMLVMMCLVVVTQTTEKNEFLMRFNTTDAEQDTRQALCCWLFLLISL